MSSILSTLVKPASNPKESAVKVGLGTAAPYVLAALKATAPGASQSDADEIIRYVASQVAGVGAARIREQARALGLTVGKRAPKVDPADVTLNRKASDKVTAYVVADGGATATVTLDGGLGIVLADAIERATK